MDIVTWKDQLGSRERRPFLFIVVADRVHYFTGDDIPGVCRVVGSKYTKQGKWSHTAHEIKLAEGARTIHGFDDFESGSFVRGLLKVVNRNLGDSVAEIATAFGVTEEGFRTSFGTRFPKAMATFEAEAKKRADAI